METLLDLVRELSFTRVGGSSEEMAAAEIILREINLARKVIFSLQYQKCGCFMFYQALEGFFIPNAI